MPLPFPNGIVLRCLTKRWLVGVSSNQCQSLCAYPQLLYIKPLTVYKVQRATSSEKGTSTLMAEESVRPPKRKRTLWKLLRWPLLGTITGCIGAFLYTVLVPDAREIRDSEHFYANWKMRAYLTLPLNVSSRIMGVMSNVNIPVSLRSATFGAFVKTYGCRMDEALVEDLSAYPNFSTFFNRPLKPAVRPISDADLVSPADGIVVHYGKIEDGRIEFVKGYDYHYSEFLGTSRDESKLKKKSGTNLYQMVIYLAPGNYHSFHSPAQWVAESEVHFPGLLLSVRPTLLLGFVPKLLCFNERVVLNGRWKHGFFSMGLVAATNVGNISIDADPKLKTNLKGSRRKKALLSPREMELKHEYKPGERVGEFRLGSTVVLVFEAPSSVQFTVKAGDHLRYGQSLVDGRI